MLIQLKPATEAPLYRQVYEALRQAILSEQLPHHLRLPASRELATQLVVSRNTINTAYAQLCAEGYIVGRQGSGYFVAAQFPETVEPTARTARKNKSSKPLAFSKRGEYLARPTRPVPTIQNPAFQPGLPDLEQFPFPQWRRCVNHALKQSDLSLFKYSDSGGYLALKQALREYLVKSRGVNCITDQIIIVNGSQAGLDLCTRLLIDSGDTVAIEEPGYLGARDGLLAAGAKLEPIPVDAEGIQVNELNKNRKNIRLVYTTPSYQFPLGVTLSLQRRLALLEWANQRNALIIEDDYDSEFRFRERPLSSLQGLDTNDRVIYFGTLSKVMFPGLRMGYLVVPLALAEGFAKALRKTGQDAPLQLQAALAYFIEQGYFASHLRRMRNLYGEKQKRFVSLIQTYLSPWLETTETNAGMQLPVFFREKKIDLPSLLEQTRVQKLIVTPLSNYYLRAVPRPGLYLGYAGIPFNSLKGNVLALKAALQATSN